MTRFAPLVAAAFFSGVAALSFEMLWVRRLGELFGAGSVSVHVVLTVFFGGMGLGARWAGARVDRRGAGLRTWVLVESWVALWGLVFFPACDGLERLLVLALPGETSDAVALAVKIATAVVLLLPATLAMGATLPILVHWTGDAARGSGTRLAWLYGTNTLGGACGVLAVVFAALPRLGVVGATAAAVGANALAVLFAWTARRPPASAAPATARRSVPRALLFGAALSGFCSVGLEVVWVRALAGRFSNTVYSFGGILSVYLASLAVGSLLLAWLDRRGWSGALASGLTFVVGGVGALVTCASLAGIDARAYGAGLAAVQWNEAVSTAAVLALPCLAFGLQLPLLMRIGWSEGSAAGRNVGAFLAWNTAGAVLAAPLVAGVGFPWLGLRTSLVLLCVAAVSYGAFAVLPAVPLPAARAVTRLGVVATALAAAWLPDLRAWREDPGDRLLHYTEGRLASVAVVQAPTGERLLKLDNHYRLGSARTRFAQERQGVFPLLLHPAPASALFLGVGTGSSVGAAVATRGTAVDALELVPEILPLLGYFAPINRDLAAAARRRDDVRLLAVDARHFVLSASRTYDVIVGDLFVPWRAGEGAMYTREHLEAVARRLEPGGSFCQWLPLYQLHADGVDCVIATFAEVFTRVDLYWLYFNAQQPVLGVVGGDGERHAVEGVPDAPVVREAGLGDVDEVRGSWITGFDGEARPEWLAGVPVETRARPIIEFAAARARVADAEGPACENLERWIERTTPLDPARGPRARATQQAVELFFRAALAEGRGDAAGALAHLGEGLDARPDWGWYASNLEVRLDAAAARGDWSRFAEVLAVLERGEGRAGPLYWRGVRSIVRDGDPSAARTAWEAALAAEPDHGPSRAQLQRLEAP